MSRLDLSIIAIRRVSLGVDLQNLPSVPPSDARQPVATGEKVAERSPSGGGGICAKCVVTCFLPEMRCRRVLHGP